MNNGMQRHIGISICGIPRKNGAVRSSIYASERDIDRKPEFRVRDSRAFYFPEIPIYDFPVF